MPIYGGPAPGLKEEQKMIPYPARRPEDMVQEVSLHAKVACAYCGSPNWDDELKCWACGGPLPIHPSQAPAQRPAPKLVSAYVTCSPIDIINRVCVFHLTFDNGEQLVVELTNDNAIRSPLRNDLLDLVAEKVGPMYDVDDFVRDVRAHRQAINWVRN